MFVKVMNIQYCNYVLVNTYNKKNNFSTYNKLHVYKYSIYVYYYNHTIGSVSIL